MKSSMEEFCKAQFTTFITHASTPSTLVWNEGADPPDYDLTIDGSLYAVEVTAVMERLQVGPIILPERGIIDSLWNFVDEVEATARSQSILTGSYIVAFIHPIADFRRVRSHIKDALLAYIRATQDQERAPEHIVLDRGAQSVRIEKIHNHGQQLHKAGPSRGKSAGEAALQIGHLLAMSLEDKAYKLRNTTVPIILLLYDSYRFATPVQFHACVPRLTNREHFHTIFVVRGTDDFVLYTSNPQWVIQSS